MGRVANESEKTREEQRDNERVVAWKGRRKSIDRYRSALDAWIYEDMGRWTEKADGDTDWVMERRERMRR